MNCSPKSLVNLVLLLLLGLCFSPSANCQGFPGGGDPPPSQPDQPFWLPGAFYSDYQWNGGTDHGVFESEPGQGPGGPTKPFFGGLSLSGNIALYEYWTHSADDGWLPRQVFTFGDAVEVDGNETDSYTFKVDLALSLPIAGRQIKSGEERRYGDIDFTDPNTLATMHEDYDQTDHYVFDVDPLDFDTYVDYLHKTDDFTRIWKDSDQKITNSQYVERYDIKNLVTGESNLPGSLDYSKTINYGKLSTNAYPYVIGASNVIKLSDGGAAAHLTFDVATHVRTSYSLSVYEDGVNVPTKRLDIHFDKNTGEITSVVFDVAVAVVPPLSEADIEAVNEVFSKAVAETGTYRLRGPGFEIIFEDLDEMLAGSVEMFYNEN